MSVPTANNVNQFGQIKSVGQTHKAAAGFYRTRGGQIIPSQQGQTQPEFGNGSEASVFSSPHRIRKQIQNVEEYEDEKLSLYEDDQKKTISGLKAAVFTPSQLQEQKLMQKECAAPFREKHLIESLAVQASNHYLQVLFYSMLNQGRKRGKETKILALDCERIQTKKGERLARISIVNFYGNVVFDTLVKPWAKVTDYREWITGIKPDDLKHAPSYPKIAPIVKKILDDKVVIGHSLQEDFLHLKLNHEDYQCEFRDISRFSCFQNSTGGKRKLKDLCCDFLNADVQAGHHSSIIDARVALALYRTFQEEIEAEFSLWQYPKTIDQLQDIMNGSEPFPISPKVQMMQKDL